MEKVVQILREKSRRKNFLQLGSSTKKIFGVKKPGKTNETKKIGFCPDTDFFGGFAAAEFLKENPDLIEQYTLAAGPIHPPGKYLIVQACETLPDTSPAFRALCCFGTEGQIRNMAALIHFDRDDPFSPVIVPWGSSCSTFITFPAGLAENTPCDTAFMGPQDPTQNYSLPPEIMALVIPDEMAERMVKNQDASFVSRRPQVAFPVHCT